MADFINKALPEKDFNNGGSTLGNPSVPVPGPQTVLSLQNQQDVEEKLENNTNVGAFSQTTNSSSLPPCENNAPRNSYGCCGDQLNPWLVVNPYATPASSVESYWQPGPGISLNAGCGCYEPFLSFMDFLFVRKLWYAGKRFCEAMSVIDRMEVNVKKAIRKRANPAEIMGSRNNPESGKYVEVTLGYTEDELIAKGIGPTHPARPFFQQATIRGWSQTRALGPQNVAHYRQLEWINGQWIVTTKTVTDSIVPYAEKTASKSKLHEWFRSNSHNIRRDGRNAEKALSDARILRTQLIVRGESTEAVDLEIIARKEMVELISEDLLGLAAAEKETIKELQRYDDYVNETAQKLKESPNGWKYAEALGEDPKTYHMPRSIIAAYSKPGITRAELDKRWIAMGRARASDAEWAIVWNRYKETYPARTGTITWPNGDTTEYPIRAGFLDVNQTSDAFLKGRQIYTAELWAAELVSVVGLTIEAVGQLFIYRPKQCWGVGVKLDRNTCECVCNIFNKSSCHNHNKAVTYYIESRFSDLYEFLVPGYFPTPNEFLSCRNCTCDVVPGNAVACLCDSCPDGKTWKDGHGCGCLYEYKEPYLPPSQGGDPFDTGPSILSKRGVCLSNSQIAAEESFGKIWNGETCQYDCPAGTDLAEDRDKPTYARIADNLYNPAPSKAHYTYATGCNYVCDGRDQIANGEQWPPNCESLLGPGAVFSYDPTVCDCLPCSVECEGGVVYYLNGSKVADLCPAGTYASPATGGEYAFFSDGFYNLFVDCFFDHPAECTWILSSQHPDNLERDNDLMLEPSVDILAWSFHTVIDDDYWISSTTDNFYGDDVSVFFCGPSINQINNP